MKNLLKVSNWFSIVIITFYISCAPKSSDEIQEEDPIISEDMDMMNLVVPEGFDFSTSREVTITIQDGTPNATYTVYAYNDLRINEREVDVTYDNGETGTDDYNQVLFTGKPFNAFLIVNGDRGREIHLPNRLRTSLGVNDPNVEGVNRDPDGN